jgi:HAD superfamily hydrolase (TIGR01509 family)
VLEKEEKKRDMTRDRDITGAIFDLDGTLLDSMDFWFTVGERYVISKGCTPHGSVQEAIATFNMTQAAEYFQDEYGITDTVPEIIAGFDRLLHDFYVDEVQPLPGALEMLDELGRRDIPYCIATTTDRIHVEAALERLGVLDGFSFIITCSELDTDKGHPDIYLESLRRLGTMKETTWIFEDAIHAIRTAARAGFPVCAIEEKSMDLHRDEIRDLADVYVNDLRAWCWGRDQRC